MVEKRGKMGKGGFRFHMTGMRFDSLDWRMGTAGGDGCALRFRALQVLRSVDSWELLCKSGIARGNWSIDGLIDRYARFAR